MQEVGLGGGGLCDAGDTYPALENGYWVAEVNVSFKDVVCFTHQCLDSDLFLFPFAPYHKVTASTLAEGILYLFRSHHYQAASLCRIGEAAYLQVGAVY